MSGMVMSFSGRRRAPGAEFYRAVSRRRIPPEAVERLAQHWVSMEPRPTIGEFFDYVLAEWEYALLTQGAPDAHSRIEGWLGFLEVLDAGVPLGYANSLKPDYSYVERRADAKRWTAGWGYSEVIAFHTAGVPAEFVEACEAAGLSDAQIICQAYAEDIPLEYLSGMS